MPTQEMQLVQLQELSGIPFGSLKRHPKTVGNGLIWTHYALYPGRDVPQEDIKGLTRLRGICKTDSGSPSSARLCIEREPAVRVVLGYFVFVYVHPYMDGNGRTARFLMNVMLASGGYPWTVLPVTRREQYLKSLEKASVEQDIKPFAELLSMLVKATMEGKPEAN
jgi:hypothetical protein